MNNSNNWTGFGTIGNELELQDHNGFKTTNKFTLFTKRNYKNRDGNYESDKIQCQASNKTAEFLTSRYQKGDSISVSGPIKTEDYTDKDGNLVRKKIVKTLLQQHLRMKLIHSLHHHMRQHQILLVRKLMMMTIFHSKD